MAEVTMVSLVSFRTAPRIGCAARSSAAQTPARRTPDHPARRIRTHARAFTKIPAAKLKDSLEEMARAERLTRLN
eukprot:5673450-Prymnesium_polylepis.1